MSRLDVVKIIRNNTKAGLLESKKAMDELSERGLLADDDPRPEWRESLDEARAIIERQTLVNDMDKKVIQELRDSLATALRDADRAEMKAQALVAVVTNLVQII